MPNFSPTDAAFEGFRFTRERPGAVGTWAAATLIFNLASAVMGALIGGSTLVEFQQLTQAPVFDWGAFAHLMPRLLPALAVTVAINMAGSAIIYPSAVRSFIGRDPKVSFHIGEDELRIFLLLLIFSVIYLITSVITGIAFGVLENIIGAFSSEVGNFITFVGGLAGVALPSMIIVRLSLAPVIAVDRKRINLKESWVSTKGHFWPLAGSLALSAILYFVVVFVGLLLVMTLAQVLSISTHGAISPKTFTDAHQTTLADLIKPAAVFGELITALMFAVLLPVACGPLVRAYQAYDAPDAPPAPVPA
jgi:hypothetical protein